MKKIAIKDYISFFIIFIFNILLITKKIKINNHSTSNIVIIFIFFIISSLLVIKTEQRDNSKLSFKIKLVLGIVGSIIILVVKDKVTFPSFMLILLIEIYMLYYVLYFFISRRSK